MLSMKLQVATASSTVRNTHSWPSKLTNVEFTNFTVTSFPGFASASCKNHRMVNEVP